MVYVITGGPGFGKTTLVDKLSELNYPVCLESARDLLNSKRKDARVDLDAKLPSDFEKDVACARLNFLKGTPESITAFSDRGLPDQIAYSWYKKKVPSSFIMELVTENKYAPFVFITPPWEDIYVQDEIRKEDFNEAVEIHSQIIRAYLKFDYKIIPLPLVNPQARVKFILSFLGI
jgi:predicted ATPase